MLNKLNYIDKSRLVDEIKGLVKIAVEWIFFKRKSENCRIFSPKG